MGRARSEHPEGNSCPMSPHKDQNSVRAQPLSSSHPPCPWQRTCFWTGLTRFESKSKNLLWDVSPSKSPSSHPINKSRSWHNSEQGSQVCWATPKRKGAPRDTIQLSETLWKMSQASRSAGNTGLVGFGGFFWSGGGRISLRCSFSSAAQKHFSERRARSGDWQFPSLCLQPWINKGNHKQVRRHWRNSQWSTDTLSHTLTCLPFPFQLSLKSCFHWLGSTACFPLLPEALSLSKPIVKLLFAYNRHLHTFSRAMERQHISWG